MSDIIGIIFTYFIISYLYISALCSGNLEGDWQFEHNLNPILIHSNTTTEIFFKCSFSSKLVLIFYTSYCVTLHCINISVVVFLFSKGHDHILLGKDFLACLIDVFILLLGTVFLGSGYIMANTLFAVAI